MKKVMANEIFTKKLGTEFLLCTVGKLYAKKDITLSNNKNQA